MPPASSASAVTSRHEVVSPDGTHLSVLLAMPPRGTPRAVGLPPVLAVHGFASSAYSGWQRTGHLDALARAGRVVIAPDLRGHGSSERPHRAEDYTLPAVLADLVAVVGALADTAMAPGTAVTDGPADAGTAVTEAPAAAMSGSGAAGEPGPRAVDLLGYSLGARLCWTIACDRRLAVRRMVLGGFDGRPLFEGVDTERLDRLAAGVPSNDREALRCLVIGLAGTGGTPPAGPLPEVPTLLVAGDADPLASRARHFAAGLPRGSFLQVAGRNHISAVPAASFRHAVVEFLGSPGAAGEAAVAPGTATGVATRAATGGADPQPAGSAGRARTDG